MSLLGTPYSQPTISDFNTAYADNPWATITTKERVYYEPVLRRIFRQKNVYARFTQFQRSLLDVNAKQMNITETLDLHPNTDQIDLRGTNLPSMHIDSRSLDISFASYGGKVSYHKYDKLITYWKQQGGESSANAVSAICQDKLGLHIVDVQDLLARNALLSTPYALYADGATGFGGLTGQSKITTDILNQIHLGMKYRDVPGEWESEDGSAGMITCITSPGVIFDLRTQTDPAAWLTPNAYASPEKLIKYEVGAYQNTRFVESKKATLFNCGDITYQTTVTTAINAGDGSPDPTTLRVDNTYRVGQPAARHYIQLDSGSDMTQYVENEIVTVHINRTSAFGPTNGVDFREGTISNRRIAPGGIDSVNKRLSFTVPLMIDYNVDLGGGVFAYVTKGVHIHSAAFLGGAEAIVMGISQPPQLHFLDPIDDRKAIYRFSWDSYQGYVNYRPEVSEIFFCGGSFREVGPMLQG